MIPGKKKGKDRTMNNNAILALIKKEQGEREKGERGEEGERENRERLFYKLLHLLDANGSSSIVRELFDQMETHQLRDIVSPQKCRRTEHLFACLDKRRMQKLLRNLRDSMLEVAKEILELPPEGRDCYPPPP